MRFGLLGSLDVVDDDGAPIGSGGAQPRMVLALLLVAAGRVVATETIVDAVWGEDPPDSALGTLQSYVSRLRRELEPGRGRGEAARLLRFEPPGYRLAVEADDVDFRRFERLADEGRACLAAGDAAAARSTLLEADALWRGPALAEYRDRDFAVGLIARLEDRRLAAIEDRLAADLALGRHTAVIGELTELVRAHPLQEGLRGHLALALYRAGRQADALRALDEARQTLRDELGVELSRPLRDLEHEILVHDPKLDLVTPAPSRSDPPRPVPTPEAGATVPAGTGSTGSTWPSGAGGHEVVAAHRLVGRDGELAELRRALDESRQATRIVVVEGEPGIGKTSLAEALAADAAASGSQVLWGRAYEGGATPSFWPWLPPLRELAADLPASELAPEIAALVAVDAGPDGGGPEPAHFALYEAVATLLAERSRSRHAMVVLDDLQWADIGSLELLTSVAGRLTDSPLLLVGTVRELEIGRNDDVVGTLAELTRRPGTRRVALRGLRADDIDELVRRASGVEIDDRALQLINERAEGNPFFAGELARLLANGDALVDVPPGVRDVVRRRLARLPDVSVELLSVAAVIGRDVELGLLARAQGSDLDTCLTDLEPAVVQRLLEPLPDAPGVFRFAHALVREVLVDDMSALARARLHQKVADALDDSDDLAEIRAAHLYEAVPIGQGGRAAEALERAAQVALRRLGYGSAQDLLTRAVALRRAAGSSRDDHEAELQAIALLTSVTAAREGYPSIVGSPMVQRGKELAEELRRDLEILSLLWAEWAGLDVACQFDRAHPIAVELLERSRSSDLEPAPILGHTAFGISCWHRGEITESAEHLDVARALVEKAPRGQLAAALFDLDQLRISIPFSLVMHDLIGDLEEPERAFDAAVRHVEGDRFWELLVMNFAASGALSTGDPERSIRAARRGIAADPEGISAFWSMACRCYLGGALCLTGDLDEGIPILDEAWARYTEMGLRTNGITFLAAKALGLIRAGHVDDGSEATRAARAELDRFGEAHARPAVLLAEAALAHARGVDTASVRAGLIGARDDAASMGAGGVARHVTREAEAMGFDLS